MDIIGICIRNLVFPLMETVKSNRIRITLYYMKRTQKMLDIELQKLQEERLRKLLTHCIENVPAYSSYKYLASIIKTDPIGALKQFPVLTKQHFKSNKDDYISKTADKNTLIPNRTGGSTGEPIQFYLDRRTVECYEAARWRGLSWHGIDIGDKSVMIWGSPLELSQYGKFIYKIKERYLKNRIIISAYDLQPASIGIYTEKLNKFKPMYIYGYASALYQFACMMNKNNKHLHFKLKCVVSTAENLYDYQREEISKAFGCPVVNEYGARDGGIIAFECKKGRMHTTAENVYLETLDVKTRQPLKDGAEGLVLATDLNNYSMPRLRYELGDVAGIVYERCECGMQSPFLTSIRGREDDFFVTTGGSLVHGHFINHIARSMTGIKQFQAIQHTPDNIEVRIVKDSNFNDSTLQKFTDEIKKVMGDINIEANYVDEISFAKSGKTRYAIREFEI